VPDNSSMFNRIDIEQIAHIQADHVHMVKLSSESDPAYGRFRTALREYLRRTQMSVTASSTGISNPPVSGVVVSS